MHKHRSPPELTSPNGLDVAGNSCSAPQLEPFTSGPSALSSLGRYRPLAVMKQSDIPVNVNDGRQAPLKIKFVVVGAGIAGLASAFALQSSGHEVLVLEEAKSRTRKAGGVRSPPNLTKILMRWGLGPTLAKTTQKCRGTPLMDLETGEKVGYLEWQEDVLKETGADFLLLHHHDLHTMLYDLAVQSGVTVQYDATVVAIDPETPSVTLSTGEVIHADVVVGADGYRSRVRDAVLGHEHRAAPRGMSIYTFNVSSDEMRSDPDLSTLLDLPHFYIWMGTGRSILAYPESGGSEFTVHLFWPDDNESSEESWTSYFPTADLDVTEYEPRVQKLMKMSDTAIRTKYMDHGPGPLEDWVHHSGKVVIIGEAAHPILPASTHGSSMAVEDGAVLGSLFSRLRTREQIGTYLYAFQDVRQARCELAANTEHSNAEICWIEPGPVREARNAGMRTSMEMCDVSWDEGHLRKQWEQISVLMGYDAYEAAEEWWVQWGSLRERAEESASAVSQTVVEGKRKESVSFYQIDVVAEVQ